MKKTRKAMQKPEIEFIKFDVADIILTSGEGPQKSPMRVSTNTDSGFNDVYKSSDFDELFE